MTDIINKAKNVTGNHKTAIKLAGIGAGAAVIGGLGYYFINVNSTTVGGSCSTSGTPCNAALAPYQKQWAACFNAWQTVNNAVLKQGYQTTEQTTLLAQYKSCMDYNAKQIATVAKKYEPTNAIGAFIAAMQPIVFDGVAIISGAVAASIIIKTLLKTNMRGLLSGTATRQAAQQSVLEADVQEDVITPEEATNATTILNENIADISTLQADVESEVEDIGSVLDLTDSEVALAVDTTETEIVSEAAIEDVVEDLAVVAAA